MAYSSKCEITVFKIQTSDIRTALPRRALVIIYFTTILPKKKTFILYVIYIVRFR